MCQNSAHLHLTTSVWLIQVCMHHVTWKFLGKPYNSLLGSYTTIVETLQLCFLSQSPIASRPTVCNMLPKLSLKQKVSIRVMNMNPSPVEVSKELATVIPETNVLLVSDENLQTKVQSPSFDHLQFPGWSTCKRTDHISF